MLPVKTFDEVELLYFIGKLMHSDELERQKFETLLKIHKELSCEFGNFDQDFLRLYQKMIKIKELSNRLFVSKYKKNYEIDYSELVQNYIFSAIMIVFVTLT